MPPLRTRQADLTRFAEHYLKHFAGQCGRQLEGFSDEALAALGVYAWPGNLRELRNAIERAVIMARGNKVAFADLPAELKQSTSPGGAETGAPQPGAKLSLEQLEELHIRRIVDSTKSLTEAAEVLGIDQATLYRKRKKIGLE